VVSVGSRMRFHSWAQLQLSCLVTAIADDPEQKRGHEGIIARLIVAGGRYSLCSVRAAWFRVAASPGSAAITVAAASQPAAITASAASGTATTGVMPS
jgi:hypothetical protein